MFEAGSKANASFERRDRGVDRRGREGRFPLAGRSGAKPGCAPPAGAPADPPDLVTVPSRQGLEAVDILRRRTAEQVGPVLHDDDHDTLGFLVPWGTAEAWDVPGSDCTRAEPAPAPGVPGAGTPPPPGATGWLVPPEEAEAVTDPRVLREALDAAARTIEAADNCR